MMMVQRIVDDAEKARHLLNCFIYCSHRLLHMAARIPTVWRILFKHDCATSA